MYNSVQSKISSGTARSFSIQTAMHSPPARNRMPPTRAAMMEVETALRIPSRLPWPMYWAMTTFVPREIPMKRLIISPTSGPLLPTAAMAFSPTKRPTTAISAALKTCCRMPVTASGSENTSILSQREPFNMSISRFILPSPR